MSFLKTLVALFWQEAVVKFAKSLIHFGIYLYGILFQSKLEKALRNNHRGIAKKVRRRINRNGIFRHKEAIGPAMRHAGVLNLIFSEDQPNHAIWVESGTACAEFARYIDYDFINGSEYRSCQVVVRTNNFLILLLLVPERNFIVDLLAGDHYDERYMATFNDDDVVIQSQLEGCHAMFITSSGTSILAKGPNSLEKNAKFKKQVIKAGKEKKVPIFLLNDICKIETIQRRTYCHVAFPGKMAGLKKSIIDGETCWVIYSHKPIIHPELESLLEDWVTGGSDIERIEIKSTNTYAYFILSKKFTLKGKNLLKKLNQGQG